MSYSNHGQDIGPRDHETITTLARAVRKELTTVAMGLACTIAYVRLSKHLRKAIYFSKEP